MILNKKQLIENANSRLQNSANVTLENSGFDIDITTLTDVKAKVTEQVFYTVKPSDFMPVTVGENAFADELLTYKTFSLGSGFEEGIIDAGSNTSKVERAEARIEGVRVPTKFWSNRIDYNLIELAQASKAGNWSLIEAKETARITAWQLGIQKMSFLGLSSNSAVKGLLTQTDVTSNTTVITKKINTMTATEFQGLLGTLLSTYFANANSTVLPDTFIIPTDDYLGLVNSVDESFPLKDRLTRLEEALQKATANPNFEIKQLAYAQSSNNDLGVNRYVLYRRSDDKSIRMDIPVDYTTTVTDTINGFDYSSRAYGQFSGLNTYRPQEMIYFDY